MRQSMTSFHKHFLLRTGPLSATRQSGFSLIEILIVMALIGTIMTIIISNLTSTQDEAMKDAARLSMGKITQSLQLYRVHNFSYPTTEQGLNALVTNPGTAKKWRGPYIESEKLDDPWGKPYEYESDGRSVKITSSGPDQSFGTEDDVSYPDGKGGEGGGEAQP
jgi:general secretion pathway protein G